jgi:hypothetical protein
MLYIKYKKQGKKRPYDHLHFHDVTAKAKKRRKKGKIYLNGTPKN